MTDLVRLSAREVVRLLKAREISPLDVIDAALARIAAVEPSINALPTLCAERARAAAERIMAEATTARAHPGWLGGLPIAVKDLSDVEGVRTTFGSPIYADNVSRQTDVTVELLERRGAVVLAKSNTPEFGAGANTFNEVFGKTRNPWNTALTAGGSSGGAAAALAAGEVWLATGSDLGGSLRTPAAFCSVVGLRPSPGRVARSAANPFDTLSVAGPMARDVADLALFLDAMVGRHPKDPLAWEAPDSPFQRAAASKALPQRVAFSPDLGFLPVEPEIAAACRHAAERLSAAGVIVEEACPDLADAIEIFHTLRGAAFAARYEPLYRSRAHRKKLKPEVVWNIERGLKLKASDIGRAAIARGALAQRVGTFFTEYDLLLCPAAPVAPFDVDIRWLPEVAGRTLETYIDWIAITFAITVSACPALSLPCGFTARRLPVGLQMVAPVGHEAALLAAAAAAEDIYGLARLLPIDPDPPPHVTDRVLES
jgi:amidase